MHALINRFYLYSINDYDIMPLSETAPILCYALRVQEPEHIRNDPVTALLKIQQITQKIIMMVIVYIRAYIILYCSICEYEMYTPMRIDGVWIIMQK